MAIGIKYRELITYSTSEPATVFYTKKTPFLALISRQPLNRIVLKFNMLIVYI
jgi:hypothetical protein